MSNSLIDRDVEETLDLTGVEVHALIKRRSPARGEFLLTSCPQLRRGREREDLKKGGETYDHMVTTRIFEHASNELGRYRRARLVLLVLPRVGEMGDDSRDPSGRGNLAGVDQDEELHQTDFSWVPN